MPKKTPRNNRRAQESRTVHSAASGVAALLQRITKGAGVTLPGLPESTANGNDKWLERLRKCLPEPLGSHLKGVLERPGELVLFTDSAAWAGRLRLALPDLAAASEGRRLTIRLQQKPHIKK